jgi:sulfur relay (sulfurtransferase) DsrF/TusC family protein
LSVVGEKSGQQTEIIRYAEFSPLRQLMDLFEMTAVFQFCRSLQHYMRGNNNEEMYNIHFDDHDGLYKQYIARQRQN